MKTNWEVLVIGGGPCGIAAAAELKKRNIESLIIEKGSVTESIRNYPKRMRFFSTAENIEIAGIPFATSNVKANRNEALQYYRKVALYFKLEFSLGTEALSIQKEADSFKVETTKGIFTSRKVILATGYFDLPRKLGIPGEDGPNTNHYYDEPYAHSFQKVVIVGGGNSAIEAALELYRHDVDVTMVVRGDDIKQTAKYWLVPDIRNRIKEGKIKLITNTRVTAISDNHVSVQKSDCSDEEIPADFVYLLVGYLPNEELLKKCGLKPDPESLLVNYDPDTFESDVEGFFLCGTVLAGVRTENVFIENGRDHAIAIADTIAGELVPQKAE